MLMRLVYAVAVAIGVGLGCLLLGLVLSSLGVPIAETVGKFLSTWCWVIGVVAGLIAFATGRTWGMP
jgi:uncharacterized membrane protein